MQAMTAKANHRLLLGPDTHGKTSLFQLYREVLGMSQTRTACCNSGRTASWAGRSHWSYSQLFQFLRCPLNYYFERILKLERPFVPSGMVLGSAVHKALAEYHEGLQHNRPVSPSQIQATFRSAWENSENQQPIQFRNGEKREALIDQGVVLLDMYMQEPPPEDILAVEQPMIVPLHTSRGEFLEKPLVAVVDLLCRDEGGLRVTELKTSGRRYSESEVETSLQASCYAHAVGERYDESVSVRYTVLVKTKKPAVQHIDTIRTDADLARLGDVIQSVERAIEAEAFYPVESQMNCTTCSFREQCRQWQGCPTRGQFEHNTDRILEVAQC